MYPYLFNNEHIPTYGVCFLVGIILACLYLFFIALKNSKVHLDDMIYSSCFALIGGLLGAKVLSILTSIDVIIEYKLSFKQIIENGFVFYGGLLGGGLGYFVYAKIYKLNFLDFTDVTCQALPLGHAIGRIGCFCSGCCFGRPTDSFLGVIYTNPLDVECPTGIKLLPTQLFESCYCILIFIGLIFIKKYYKNIKTGTLTFIYIVTYAFLRFINEFLRYDSARGSFWIFSTSQWISIFLVLLAVGMIIYQKNKKNSNSINQINNK